MAAFQRGIGLAEIEPERAAPLSGQSEPQRDEPTIKE
jgi:hypothetical protein